jgi:hypothetical protein
MIILSNKEDFHARAVSWGLNEMGIKNIIVPHFLDHEGEFELNLEKKTIRLDRSEISYSHTIWFRRVAPLAAFLNIGKSKEFKYNESITSFRWLLSAVNSESQKKVNDYFCQEKANSKFYQYQLAKTVGLLVPFTEFKNKLEKGDAGKIYKPMTTFTWENESNIINKRTRVFELNKAHIEYQGDKFFPMILQKRIRKDRDVRIVYIGQQMFSMSIKKIVEDDVVDWRECEISKNYEFSNSAIPDSVSVKIKKFMTLANLNFGCIDFVVDGSDWWFLEVNTQGQWLYMQELGFKENLLGHFCSYLSNSCQFYDRKIVNNYVSLDSFEMEHEVKNKNSVVENV